MPLTRQQEQEIYPLLDKVAELAPDQGVLYKCTTRRADYLVRMIQGLRYDNAIESIQMYPPDSPLYGRGLYACLWVEVQPKGLLLTKLSSPHDSVKWRLILCAATKKNTPLPTGTRFNKAQIDLGRMQKKHPEIMNHIYLTPDEPVTARYGEPGEEEMVVVDIDLNPKGAVPNPTAEQTAKADSMTRHRKPL